MAGKEGLFRSDDDATQDSRAVQVLQGDKGALQSMRCRFFQECWKLNRSP
jgi:hypothetical protein